MFDLQVKKRNQLNTENIKKNIQPQTAEII